MGFLVGCTVGGALGRIVSMLHSVLIEQQEAKQRFDKGYGILSKSKQFLTASDIQLLEECSGHKYEDDYDK